MADNVSYNPPLPWTVRPNDNAMGQCLAGVEDWTGGMVNGRVAHAQALLREAITPPGTNVVNRDYGADITYLLDGRANAVTLHEASTRLVARWRVDDRTKDASVSLTLANNVLVGTATIWDKDGPFPFTFSVSEAGANILGKVQ